MRQQLLKVRVVQVLPQPPRNPREVGRLVLQYERTNQVQQFSKSCIGGGLATSATSPYPEQGRIVIQPAVLLTIRSPTVTPA